VLPPEAYGGHKDVNEAWVAGTLAVGAWSTPAEAPSARLAVPGELHEAWEERLAIMRADGHLLCPPTPHGWRGRGSRPSGGGGDAWDHNQYRSWATSVRQGTPSSALRGRMELYKLTDGFPIVFAKFKRLRNYTFFHNEF
jgi:hypothetical protein